MTAAAAQLVAAAVHPPDALTAAAVAVACAVLSVFVVSRRWAFIGEGISHSALGGAGTVWLLALAYPALDAAWAVSAGVVAFCLATGLGIAFFSRARPGGAAAAANIDAVIGIFLVASVAWGFLAQSCYAQRHNGGEPPAFRELLFGQFAGTSPQFALGATLVCAAVVTAVALLRKELVYYCFDPAMAEASGVAAGFVHYLLVLLVTLTIVVGARVAGSILVTALLVLPGATGLLLSNRLQNTMVASVMVGLIGAAGGMLVRLRWPFLPTGPSIVLVMFASFLLAYAWARVRSRA